MRISYPLPAVTADGGSTWLSLDSSNGSPFEGTFVEVNDVIAFGGGFLAVGAEPAGVLPGVGAVWIGTLPS